MTILAILTLILAVGSMAIAWLANHGKLKWSKDTYGFWGNDSHLRKYKNISPPDRLYEITKAPDTYYYKLFNVKYKERFPLSATFLVFLTDGMHLSQAAYHVFLALSLSLFSGYGFLWFWIGIVVVHATVYRLLSK